MDIIVAAFALIAAVVIIGLFSALKFVPQGYNWTVERFGPVHQGRCSPDRTSSTRSLTGWGAR